MLTSPLQLQAKSEEEDETDQAMIKHALEMLDTLKTKAGIPDPDEDEDEEMALTANGASSDVEAEAEDAQMAVS